MAADSVPAISKHCATTALNVAGSLPSNRTSFEKVPSQDSPYRADKRGTKLPDPTM
jgi:hypothetical protein